MIWFDLNDLRSILVIIACLFVNISLFYYPYFSILKNHQKYLPYFIVTSISVYIILGYIFYCFRSLNIYPLTYIISFAILNIFLLVKNKYTVQLNFSFPKVLIFLSLLFIFVYYFFYDALRNITPDNYYDVSNHISFFNSIKTYGQINMAYYAPGFHIPFYLAFLIIGGSNLYRFLGPILGLLITLNLYFISATYFTKKSSRILLLLLTLFPFFKLLSIQYITLWPTTTSYLFLPVLIALLFFNQLNTKKQIVLYIINLAAFSLTIPYVLLQYVPVTIIICALSILLFRKIKTFHQPKYFLTIAIITAFCTVIPAVHVFLQTQVISKNKSDRFPGIQILKKENNKIVVSNVYQETIIVNLSPTIPVTITPTTTPTATTTPTPISSKIFINPKITNNYLLPLIATIKSALTTKTVVPFSPSSLKTYLYLLVSLLLTIFSIFTKNHKLFIISAFSFLFGLISQFGFLELTQYRGRTGPYIVFMSIFTATYFYDKIKFNHPILVSIILLSISIIILKDKPFVFSHEGVCPEIFEQVYVITKKFPDRRINIITEHSQISMLSNQITAYSLNSESLFLSKKEDSYLILQQNYCEQPPADLLQANSHDPTYQYSLIIKQKYLDNAKSAVKSIEQSSEFTNFKLIWQNQNISVYHRPKSVTK